MIFVCQIISDYIRRRLRRVVRGHPGDATDSYSKLGLIQYFDFHHRQLSLDEAG
jgi:hypothetical protein